jgi:ABC-type multidrug transport system ATPase subunit
MWTTLTVADTLMYAALLRLPERMPREEKRARVEGIIRMLGLEKCKARRAGSASRIAHRCGGHRPHRRATRAGPAL